MPAFFYKKETPTQVFSYKYCEIFKNNFFIEDLPFIILFQNFFVMIEFFGGLRVQNW